MLCNGTNHCRMAVTNGRYVIVGVQIGRVVFVIEPDTFAAHRGERLFVEQSIAGP
ncbi:hypothetical protein D3C85_1814830 [compost metagenome]